MSSTYCNQHRIKVDGDDVCPGCVSVYDSIMEDEADDGYLQEIEEDKYNDIEYYFLILPQNER